MNGQPFMCNMLELVKAIARETKTSKEKVLLTYLLQGELPIYEDKPLFTWSHKGTTHHLGFQRLNELTGKEVPSSFVEFLSVVNYCKVLNLLLLVSYECELRGTVTHAFSLRYCARLMKWFICDPRENKDPHEVTHANFGNIVEGFFENAIRIVIYALQDIK